MDWFHVKVYRKILKSGFVLAVSGDFLLKTQPALGMDFPLGFFIGLGNRKEKMRVLNVKKNTTAKNTCAMKDS